MKKLLLIVALSISMSLTGCNKDNVTKVDKLMVMNHKDYYWSLDKDNYSIEIECSDKGQYIKTHTTGNTNFISVVGDTVYCGINDTINNTINKVDVTKEVKDQVSVAITNISGLVNKQINVDSLYCGADGSYTLNGTYNNKKISCIVELDSTSPVITDLYAELNGSIVQISEPRGIISDYDVEVAGQETFNKALSNILNSIKSMNLDKAI